MTARTGVNLDILRRRLLRVTCPDLTSRKLYFSHRGRISVIVSLDRLPANPEDAVVLRFRRALQVKGVLRSPEGNPLSGKTVRIYTTRTTSYAGFSKDDLLDLAGASGCGATMGASQSKDVARITLSSNARTDSDGAFSASIQQDGETSLLLWEEGLEPVLKPLGTLLSDADLGTVVAAFAPSDHLVEILWEGKPQAGKSILLVDFRLPDSQPTAIVHLDSRGRFSAGWLVRGAEYFVGLSGTGAPDYRLRWTTWNGEDTIDLAHLLEASRVLTERGR